MLSEPRVHPQDPEPFKHQGKNVVIPSRFFTADGFLKLQSGHKTAQDSFTTGPRGSQNCFKNVSKRTKRALQDVISQQPSDEN
eukprot:9162033-Pyramimonas_sp.AAC.1